MVIFMVIFRKSVPIAVKIIAAFIFDVYRPCEKEGEYFSLYLLYVNIDRKMYKHMIFPQIDAGNLFNFIDSI